MSGSNTQTLTNQLKFIQGARELIEKHGEGEVQIIISSKDLNMLKAIEDSLYVCMGVQAMEDLIKTKSLEAVTEAMK